MPANRSARLLVTALAVAMVAAACSSTVRSASPPGADSPPASGATTTSAPVGKHCSPARSVAPSTQPQTIVSGGHPRQYLISLPTHYDGTRAWPLILEFHGSGSDMLQQAAYSSLPLRGAAAGFVVITPGGTGNPKGWNISTTGSPDDFGYAHDLIAWAERSLCIDPARIFAAGISLGSAFAAVLPCQPPHEIAAIGLVSAEVPPLCANSVGVSVIGFHGTADPIVPYGGGKIANSGAGNGTTAPGSEAAMADWAAHDGCGPTPQVTQVSPHVRRSTWTGCRPGLAVTFNSIEGGGHTWPGGPDLSSNPAFAFLGAVTHEISATDLMLSFFEAHPAVAPG
jgi:polyhydroxybutyrate depolymerase